jgi:hypothetical protein
MNFNSKYFKIEQNRSRYFTLVLSSGGEDSSTATLHTQMFGHWADLRLPKWVCPPMRVKVYPKWDMETVNRLGRNWYWKETQREFGVTLADEWVFIRYGVQSNDSDEISRSISISLGWKLWDYVGIDYFDTDNKTILKNYPSYKFTLLQQHEIEYEFNNSIPSETHTIIDFDGESISVKCRIEQRTWNKGDGMFKWLRHIHKPLVIRVVNLLFSDETGARKGSYKGGTIGASVEIFVGETIIDALKRYCDKNAMTIPILDV